MAGGRNRLQIDLARVEELAGLGLTHEQIALALGIAVRTLQTRKASSADFAAAIEKGRAQAAQVVANVLFERAKAGDMTAVIWYEKTRQGRTDRVEQHHSGVIGTARVELSEDEERQLREALIR